VKDKSFKPIDLEENEQGLGQQEFDEDLIEKVVQEVEVEENAEEEVVKVGEEQLI
jgi:hypothetical protein